jgi:hypothetical protein
VTLSDNVIRQVDMEERMAILPLGIEVEAQRLHESG